MGTASLPERALAAGRPAPADAPTGTIIGLLSPLLFPFLFLVPVLTTAGCHGSNTPRAVADAGGLDQAGSGGKLDGATAPPDGAVDTARSGDGTSAPPPPHCTKSGASPTKPQSQACGCDDECQSGFCVDGVCCESACTDTCKSCGLPSALGLCTPIPAGVTPTDPVECTVTDPKGCGTDGTCDGAGKCRLYPSQTPCKAGTCDGEAISGALVCDGKGSCGPGPATSCYPYACDAKTGTCAASCITDAECSSGIKCQANSCGKKMNGAGCAGPDDCASGFCSDKVCCNEACAGACMACDQVGSKGVCRLIEAGLPDPAFCAVTDRSTCDTTGLCDGFGTCSNYPTNTLCSAPSCAGDTALGVPRTCDGLGVCGDLQLIDCTPFRCANGACGATCATDADCAPSHPCVQATVGGVSVGRCSGKLGNGQKCAAATDCESSQCVDGVCCESACTGACRSCALPGSPGQCKNVAASAADPHRTCKDAGVASCGTDGLCDGTGACEKYKVDTECGPETCANGVFTDNPKCNAAGQCVAPPSRTCSPFVCSGTACLGACTKDTDCQAPNTCIAGSCGKKPAGASCGAGSECQSTFCAQGICCNSACKGACTACNLSGSTGICSAVRDGQSDPQGLCASTSSASCGTTGSCKGGACAFWQSGQKCKDGKCNGTSATPSSTCDGKGNCTTPSDQACGNYTCDSSKSSCRSSCATDSDCVSPNTCVGNSCGKKPAGAACTAANQCSTGFCTEGVCCNSACSDATGTSGLCQSCKVTGKVGTCAPVVSGAADPKGRCTATSAALGNCGGDGTCNGAGACRPWSTATGCRQASCAGGVFTPAASCDGKGTCPAATTSKCDPYICSTTSPSCTSTCTKNADCAAGLTCLAGNQCGTTLPNGKSCKASTDCTSGHCTAEGVCCDTDCTGGCQSCTVVQMLGTCAPIAAGGTPRDASLCVKGDACGNTAKCDGNGGCQVAAIGTACGSASCAGSINGSVGGVSMTESVARVPAGMCDGAGTCTPATNQIACGAYQCSGGACKTKCSSTDTDCNAIGGYTCQGSSCLMVASSGGTSGGGSGGSGSGGVTGTGGKTGTGGSGTGGAGTGGAGTGGAGTGGKIGTGGASTGGSGTGGSGTGGASTGGSGTGGSGTGGAATPKSPLGATCTSGSACMSNLCVTADAGGAICCASACAAQTDPCGNKGTCAAGGASCVPKLADGAVCAPGTCGLLNLTATAPKTCNGGTCSAGGNLQLCTFLAPCQNGTCGGSAGGGAK